MFIVKVKIIQEKGKLKMSSQLKNTEVWINQETGEQRTFAVEEIEVNKDWGFEKTWLKTLLSGLDIIGNKKIKVANYLIKNRQRSDNIIIATQRKIAKETEVSLPVVAETMKELRNTGFLKLVQNGVYMINPSAILKGDRNKRIGLMVKFSSIKDGKELSKKSEKEEDRFKKFDEIIDSKKKKKEQKTSSYAANPF